MTSPSQFPEFQQGEYGTGCDALRLDLHAYVDGQLAEEKIPAVEAHLSGCRCCRAEIESIRFLGAELRANLPLHTTPAYLQKRIEALQQDVRPPRPRRPWRSRRFIALVALSAWVLSLVAVTAIFNKRDSAAFPAPAFVQDHVNYLKNRELAQISLNDPERLQKWFSERVDFRPNVPTFKDARLVGGRVCKVAGERVVLAYWEKGGDVLTLFARPDDTRLDLNIMKKVLVGQRIMHETSADGYNLLLWRENGLLYVLVTDHPQHDMSRYANSLFS